MNYWLKVIIYIFKTFETFLEHCWLFHFLLQFDILIVGDNDLCYLMPFSFFYVIGYMMMATAPPLAELIITISSLSCRSSRDFCCPFKRFEYFGGFICAISSLISLFVASIIVSIVWWRLRDIHVLSVGFLNMSSSVFGLFLWSLKCALSVILR